MRHFACPEVFLGLIPGWGGTQLIPRLVGAETAVVVQSLAELQAVVAAWWTQSSGS